MESLKCPNCSSVSFREDAKSYICEYCGSTIMKDPARMTSQVLSNSSIDALLKRADIYWDMKQKGKAQALYRQVLQIDATCARARARSK